MSNLYVVTGAGPVGSTIAHQLADRGDRVRLLTRSGSGPDHPLIERLRADVSQSRQLAPHLDGATALFHCIHGSAYSERAWRRELPAAEQTVLAAAGRGLPVVFPESLYAFGPITEPMTERTPRSADFGKPAVRVELLAARAASETPTVSVLASDFFGPGVLNAHAGERMVPKVLTGRKVLVLGDPAVPHSFTYVPDLAAAMIIAAGNERLWNRELMAPTGPALSQRALAQAFADAGGAGTVRVGRLPSSILRALGLVHPPTRELTEMLYQFERPFVMDSSHSEELLGLHPTPLPEAVAVTVAWWRARSPQSAAA